MPNQITQPDLPLKLVYLVIAVICMMIGVIGLIIPVIPGVLFLIAAVFMLNKVSGRFKRWSEQHPMIRKIQMKMNRLDAVDLATRLKVMMLMGLEVMVKSMGSVASAIRRLTRKFS